MLVARGLSKRFGATIALDDVDIELSAGEVRALVGENGAGKSTLLSILAGASRADAGSITFDGAAFAPRSCAEARARGVAMVHQELSIAPDLSVEANISLGLERSRAGFVRRSKNEARARAALARLGLEALPLRTRAGELPIATRQRIEIARALASNARVLILDEPASSLAKDDAERLVALVRELARDGLAIAYVSHFLDEVRSVADVFTVLRDGAVVDAGVIADADDARLFARMAGRELVATTPLRERAFGEVLLTLEGLRGARAPRDVTLGVRRGEVFGLAGLVGSGRSALLRCIYGLNPRVAGRALSAERGALARGPRASIRAGAGFVSEDRKHEGLALDLSLSDNIALPRWSPFVRAGVVSNARSRARSSELLDRLECRRRSSAQAVRELSGGNQQKVALARLLHQVADVWLLDEPTRGIDVGAKARVHALVREKAGEGAAILVTSSDLRELTSLCDTLGVLCRGALVEVREAEAWTREELVACMSGARDTTS